VTTDGCASSQEDSDDEVDIELLAPPSGQTECRRSRISFSAEAYGEINQKKVHIPPVFQKTEEDKLQIKAWIEQQAESSFLFRGLEEKDL